MNQGYTYIDLLSRQIPKKPGNPSGDLVVCERTAENTVIILCDGLGHGIKASIAAHLFSSRFLELLKRGVSFRKAFLSLAKASEDAKGKDLPYCAFNAVRILSDGLCSFLCYEAPLPLLVTPRYGTPLTAHSRVQEGVVISEGNCYLSLGEGIMLFSDGITQAGLGRGFPGGWGEKGAAKWISDSLSAGKTLEDLPSGILTEALALWGGTPGDDCSAALAKTREGIVVNLLSGPPSDPSRDGEVINRFLRTPGIHVICGGTTAKIAAAVLGRELGIERTPPSLIAPPRLSLEGVDLVTEGAVTLNQLFNILEEDSSKFDERNAATDLYSLLHAADRVNLILGRASNPAGSHISFRQKGILGREKILPLLAERLKSLGKLVVLEEV